MIVAHNIAHSMHGSSLAPACALFISHALRRRCSDAARRAAYKERSKKKFGGVRAPSSTLPRLVRACCFTHVMHKLNGHQKGLCQSPIGCAKCSAGDGPNVLDRCSTRLSRRITRPTWLARRPTRCTSDRTDGMSWSALQYTAVGTRLRTQDLFNHTIFFVLASMSTQ